MGHIRTHAPRQWRILFDQLARDGGQVRRHRDAEHLGVLRLINIARTRTFDGVEPLQHIIKIDFLS